MDKFSLDKYEKYESSNGNIWLKKKLSETSTSTSYRPRPSVPSSYSFPTTPAFRQYMHGADTAAAFGSACGFAAAGDNGGSYRSTMASLLSKFKQRAEESDLKLHLANAEKSKLMAECQTKEEALKCSDGETSKLKQHMTELIELLKTNEAALAEVREENGKVNTELQLATARLDELPVMESRIGRLQDKLGIVEKEKYNAERKCKLLEDRLENSSKETRKFIENAVDEQNASKERYSQLEKSFHALTNAHAQQTLKLDAERQQALLLEANLRESERQAQASEQEVSSLRAKLEENDTLIAGFVSFAQTAHSMKQSRANADN